MTRMRMRGTSHSPNPEPPTPRWTAWPPRCPSPPGRLRPRPPWSIGRQRDCRHRDGEERGRGASPRILSPMSHLVLAMATTLDLASCPRITEEAGHPVRDHLRKITWKLFSLALWNYNYNLNNTLFLSFDLYTWIKSKTKIDITSHHSPKYCHMSGPRGR